MKISKTEQINRTLVLLGFLYQFLGSCFLDKETEEAKVAVALMDLIVHQKMHLMIVLMKSYMIKSVKK